MESDKLKGTSKNSCFVLVGLFAPTLRSENLEIHPVFLRLSELNLEQKSSPNPKTIVFRGTLKFENKLTVSSEKGEYYGSAKCGSGH